MIYLGIQILSYNQLLKIDEESTLAIREYLQDIVTTQYDGSLIHQNDFFIARVGDEKTVSPAKTADCISTLNAYLQEQEEKLYGFILLGFLIEDSTKRQDLLSLTRKFLLTINGENEIWVDSGLKLFLKDFFVFEQDESFWRVSESMAAVKAEERVISESFSRPLLFSLCMDGIAKRLNKGKDEAGLILKGPADYGSKSTSWHIALRFYKGEEGVLPIRLFTIFRRQSPIHPFLNSIDSNLIDKVPHFLSRTEMKIWDDGSKLINYLKNQEDRVKCPDRLFEDFFAAYDLYLAAYIRMMEERLFPTIFICEDIETYHSDSISALSKLLSNFMRHSSFLPILMTTQNDISEEILQLNFDVIEVGAVGWKEIKTLAASMFPGLSLPRYVARRIHRSTQGKYLPALHYLFHLNSTGKIQMRDDSYLWLPRNEKYVSFPKNTTLCTVNLLKNLDSTSQDVLYTIYLTGGLLNRVELSGFLDFHGIKNEESEKIVRYLGYLGFLSEGDSLMPSLPGFKKRIESIMEGRAEGIQKDLLEFVVRRHHEGNYRHLILLFYFFIKNRKHRLAIKVLSQIIRQKLNERDYKGVLPFLNFNQNVFKDTVKKEEQERIDLFIRSCKLRFSLNNDNSEALEEVTGSPRGLLPHMQPCRERGYYLLECVGHYLQNGNAPDAIEACKLSLIDFNDFGEREDEARAYTELGCTMLAGGKLKDAIEYFTLSERILSKPSFDRLKCLGFTGIVYFLYGNLTNALKVIQESNKLADGLGQREWQLFLLFFEGRILFHLGDYKSAAVIFQRCLTLADLYSFLNAPDVLYAWLARSHIYIGQIEDGVRILEGMEANQESCLFMSEAFYFQKRYNEALSCLAALTPARDRVFPYPGERVFWYDGFVSIEGRCLFLERDETLLERLSHSFKAYLLAILGDRGEASDELQAATRLTKLNDLDFFNSLYLYFYSQTLPEYGEEEAVDRLTVLNKALRLLQERAGRIESVDQRSMFLSKNRWNKILMDEAQKRRLL